MRLAAALLWLLAFLTAGPAWAAGEGAGGREDLILEIRLDGKPIADSFAAVTSHGTVYLPVSQFAALLEIDALLGFDRQSVQGRIGESAAPWIVDAALHVLRRDGRETPLPPDSVFVGTDDLYLDVGYFAMLWPVQLTLRLNLLRLDITTTEPLPLEARLAREAAHRQLQFANGGAAVPDYPLHESPYVALSVPQGDVSLGTSLGRGQTPQQTYSALLTGDLGYMSDEIFLDGTLQHPLADARLLLSRADPRGDVLGVPGMRQFAVGDITTPAFETITNGRLERGVLVSSFPLGLATGTGRTVIEGDALPGWEVELYRNDALLDFQIVPADGRYRFPTVPLLVGNNVIRLEFYGTQGQRRTETRRLLVGPGVAAAGESLWRFSLSDSNQTLIRSANLAIENAVDNVAPAAGPVGSAEYVYGLRDDTSLGAAFIRAPRNGQLTVLPGTPTVQNFGSTFVQTTQLGVLLTQYATLSDNYGTAFESTAQTALGHFGLTTSYAQFHDFQSEQVGFGGRALRQEARARLDGVIPPWLLDDPISFSLEGVRDAHDDGGVNYALLHGLFFRLGPVYVSNAVTLQQDAITGATTDETVGNLTLSGIVDPFGLRGDLQYDPQDGAKPQFFTGTLDWHASQRTIYSGTVDHNLTGSPVTGFTASVSRDFEKFLLGAAVRVATDRNITFGLNLTFSFGVSAGGSPVVSARPVAATGAVAARVFLDRNANGVFDAGDELLPSAGLDINHHRDFQTTNDGTYTERSGLQPYVPTNVAVDERSLQDPYWKPVGGVSVIPRPGHTTTVDLPVVETADLEGTVLLVGEGDTRPLARIKLALIDAQGAVAARATSAYDGYFYFSRILPGRYSLIFDPDEHHPPYEFTFPPPLDLRPGEIKSGAIVTARRVEGAADSEKRVGEPQP